MFFSTKYQTPLGIVTLASDGDNLVGLWLAGQKYHGGSIADAMMTRDDLPVFDATRQWLTQYFAGERPAIDALPLAPIGSAFRQRIWRQLCGIPYGQVVSYGEIARKLAESLGDKPTSCRAVGGAVGHNPISIIIPCHRVIGADGSLTGYAGGVDIKAWLLRHEGVKLDALS